jgi:hypothetical protein
LVCAVKPSCSAWWRTEPDGHILEGVWGGKNNLNMNRQPIPAMKPLPFPLHARKYNARDDCQRRLKIGSGPLWLIEVGPFVIVACPLCTVRSM